MMLRLFRFSFAPFVMLTLLCLFPVTAHAASDQCEKDFLTIAAAITTTHSEEMQKTQQAWDTIAPALVAMSDKIGEAIEQVNTVKLQLQEGTMDYNYLMANFSVENTVAAQTAQHVRQTMEDNAYQSSSGRLQTVNSSLKDRENIEVGIQANIDARYLAIINTKFCDPDSLNLKDSCEAKPVGKRENFIDFFLSDRPWQTVDVVDAANVAQRLLGGPMDMVFLGESGLEPTKLIQRQRSVTIRNMRMSILNTLAMRRAPVSQATAGVLKTMFSILNPNGGGSVSYKEACMEHKASTAADVYACSHASTMGGTHGLMSESAFEKIFDFDYLISKDFYSDLNAPAATPGSINKLAVVLKARQLAQDYRALRLLQMKTAMAAVNMMTSPGKVGR